MEYQSSAARECFSSVTATAKTMKKFIRFLSVVIVASILILPIFAAAPDKSATASKPVDPGWPRQFKGNGQELVVYQPQVDSWDDYSKLHYRAAISFKAGSGEKEIYGVAEGDAETAVDQDSRSVEIKRTGYEVRFPNIKAEDAAAAEKSVRQLVPESSSFVISLDRLLAMLDPAKEPLQRQVEVSVEPPKIFYSAKNAILVILMGAPQFKPVDKERPDLMFAVNTNWDVFFDTTQSRYYLLDGESWLTASDPVKGPWTAADKLPGALSNLPPNENWSDVKKNIPGKTAKEVPAVFVSIEPAEMILTKGEPAYAPISGTKLMRVSNTDSTLFLNSADKQYYFLVAGRWFRAADLSGPWSAASSDLPPDFAAIPDSNPASFVKASVPGTDEAKDAVLLASVPRATTVSIDKPLLEVVYSGEPKFEPIKGTNVQYATNSANAVFLVSGGFYCCDKGAWYCGGTAKGPWAYCTSVPKDIYSIPPSHPAHNVTYVKVQSSTPTTVTYVQTSGYSGEYVAANGVLMFGAGLLVGALIANNNNCYYCYPAPYYYSYGCGAHYRYGYGGYYAAAGRYYGPYGGAGRYAAYNPYTGTYSRGAYVYGPAGGSAGYRQAYNPYTDTYAARATMKTPHGSSGRFYAEQGNKSVWGGHESGARGTVGWAEGNKGGQAVAWDTRRGQGAVAKDKNDNLYVGRDGNVYKRDAKGNWSSPTGSTPDRASSAQSRNDAIARQSGATARQTRPADMSTRGQASSKASASNFNRETFDSLDRAASARQKGNRETKQVSQFQSQRSSGGLQRQNGGGGRARSGGDGGRRR
jgi:hypothetical protein